MEVGPLARMVIAYASGEKRVKELVDDTLKKLDLPLTALFSTMGRTAARGLEGLWAAEKLKEEIARLQANIRAGNTATANNEKWEPKTWPAEARGAGYSEAPRGALGHWIRIKGGKMTTTSASCRPPGTPVRAIRPAISVPTRRRCSACRWPTRPSRWKSCAWCTVSIPAWLAPPTSSARTAVC
jgi:Ni,Fe-hydrogenase III large subunit